MRNSSVFAIIMGLILFQLALYPAEQSFSFGEPPVESTAKVSIRNNCYVVICSFKPRSKKKQSDEVQSMFYEQRAKGICLKAIVSYRNRKKVSRCSVAVRGMSLEKKLKKNDELVFVFTVPVDGVVEKNVQFVQ